MQEKQAQKGVEDCWELEKNEEKCLSNTGKEKSQTWLTWDGASRVSGTKQDEINKMNKHSIELSSEKEVKSNLMKELESL